MANMQTSCISCSNPLDAIANSANSQNSICWQFPCPASCLIFLSRKCSKTQKTTAKSVSLNSAYDRSMRRTGSLYLDQGRGCYRPFDRNLGPSQGKSPSCDQKTLGANLALSSN